MTNAVVEMQCQESGYTGGVKQALDLNGAVPLLLPLPFDRVLFLVCDGCTVQLQSYFLVQENMDSVANPSESRCTQL